MTTWLTWREAMDRALYAPDGFYRRPGGGPVEHFRTSVHNPVFGDAVARLLVQVDEALGAPATLDLVDVGSGRGELILAVVAELAASRPELLDRLRISAVEVGPRPSDLAERIAWRTEVPADVHGLLIANEWLDNVACDVAEVGPDGTVRIVEVDTETGAERLGPPPDAEQSAWLARWWPLDGREPGARAEIGLDRDAAWRAAAASLTRGMAVAIDYSHVLGERPAFGTLTGYRDGQQVEPIPDGTCDVTAHVALDACAAACAEGDGVAADVTGTAAAAGTATTAHATAAANRTLIRPTAASTGAVGKVELTTQREALHRLGISGARPPIDLAHRDPRAYVRALSRASAAAELTDAAGLGGFGWLALLRGLDRVDRHPAPV